MCTKINGLTYYESCWCAGTGCGGHLVLSELTITPIGWQGVAQHTWTIACDGFHEPGPCSPSQRPVTVEFGDSA